MCEYEPRLDCRRKKNTFSSRLRGVAKSFSITKLQLARNGKIQLKLREDFCLNCTSICCCCYSEHGMNPNVDIQPVPKFGFMHLKCRYVILACIDMKPSVCKGFMYSTKYQNDQVCVYAFT